jgi:hypothetical protein
MTEKEKVAIRHNLAMAQHQLAELKKPLSMGRHNNSNYILLESISIWVKQAQDVVNKDVK